MKIHFISLGCDKNLTDSEKMLALLAGAGHVITDDPAEAECIIVNTCCFIGDAKEESIFTLLEAAEQKKTGKCRLLLAGGCLAQRYQENFFEEIPEVDGILGTNSFDRILDLLAEAEEHPHTKILRPLTGHPNLTERLVTTGGHYAHLKIAEGCDKNCTYCVIPSVRGAYRSRPMEELLEEARALAQGGVRELILVAQETTLYGKDLYGEKRLPELLEALSEIPEIEWIRLQYCYPEEITPEIIRAVRDLPKVCKYLDIPIQSGSDRILKRMGRRTDSAHIRAIVARLREEIPEIALRTTLISGFPGETPEDHQQTMQLVADLAFDRLGVFPYSREEETPAAQMEDQIEESVKQARADEIMALQEEIADEKAQELIGCELRVVVEGKVADEDAYVARSYMDAPDVDGYVFIQTDRDLMSGDFVDVVITDAEAYDLIGELTDEDEPAE